MTECQYLNSIRANYTICCQYPVLVVWNWLFRACYAECRHLGMGWIMSCCVNICCYKSGGMLDVINFENGTVEKVNIVPKGIANGLMLSIGNDSRWTSVIEISVERCYEQFFDPTPSRFCAIPDSIFEVIDCTYTQNFMKCPIWNPHGIAECEYTMRYVTECYHNLQ